MSLVSQGEFLLVLASTIVLVSGTSMTHDSILLSHNSGSYAAPQGRRGSGLGGSYADLAAGDEC